MLSGGGGGRGGGGDGGGGEEQEVGGGVIGEEEEEPPSWEGRDSTCGNLGHSRHRTAAGGNMWVVPCEKVPVWGEGSQISIFW